MARRSDHTRDELTTLILDTAYLIVGKDGAEGLTARRLADAIGYAPGTIYNLFASMEDVYLRVNARTLDLLHGVLNSPACHDPKKTPAQNMKKMALLYRDFAQKERRYWLMLFNHNLPVHRHKDGWYQEKVDRLFDALETLLGPFFSARQERKKKMAARILWASTHGLCFLEETGKMPSIDGNTGFEEMSAMLVDGFLAGMQDKNISA